MRAPLPDLVPLLHPACRITVAIPARNESALLTAALAAMSEQRDLAGAPLARGTFEVLVFANNCSDATADLARKYALAMPDIPLYVVEDRFDPADAHIGTARKYIMDLAAARFLRAGRPQGIIASTDSDTVVDPHWIASTLGESHGVDAIAGQVTIADADQQRLLAPVRLLYARELTYRRLIAEVEALIDPVPEDPLPRHSSFVGASFAVTASTYVAAGALPPRPCLEDQHFCRALRRIDARIRHSTLVRASTSARMSARVEGGFGTFITSLRERAIRGETFRVEHPQRSIDAFAMRAALRRLWPAGTLDASTADLAALPPGILRHWQRLRAEAVTLGALIENVMALDRSVARADVDVEFAIDTLRRVVQCAARPSAYARATVLTSA